VFSRTKHGANRLAEQLDKDGITALAIHGNKSQGARTRALAEFKDGSLQVLVATDIAARGIDIDQLPHVVNYDLPNVPEDYVHRIGRTGRAGATGEAVSLVCVDEHAFLRDIERLIKREIESEVIPGFEPDPTARPEPILQRQGRGGASQGRRPAAGGGRSGQAPARSTQPAGRAPGNGNRGRGAGQPAPAGGRLRTSGSGSHATPARASQPTRAAQPAQPAARPAAAPQRHNAPRRGGALLGGK
jgi:ATP-dependent RNA helicase RhlE